MHFIDKTSLTSDDLISLTWQIYHFSGFLLIHQIIKWYLYWIKTIFSLRFMGKLLIYVFIHADSFWLKFLNFFFLFGFFSIELCIFKCLLFWLLFEFYIKIVPYLLFFLCLFLDFKDIFHLRIVTQRCVNYNRGLVCKKCSSIIINTFMSHFELKLINFVIFSILTHAINSFKATFPFKRTSILLKHPAKIKFFHKTSIKIWITCISSKEVILSLKFGKFVILL